MTVTVIPTDCLLSVTGRVCDTVSHVVNTRPGNLTHVSDLTTNVTNPRLFQIRFQYIVLEFDLKSEKVPYLFHLVAILA